ncbi:MAG: methyltransferase [Armatimonadota bacterium]|nr:methyltransferase [Armatimonadota bacterium]MDR7459948.1 methyltransferase [Armatimonadota bacterium]MDR7479604.1 methyltransferase [Armatimonadota bacterium]MDR7488575.1 methyltransferase [Armatimonadota bacterium]MDR7490577.1 methyltransferase [Armatimonadota bacterium]
MGEARGAGGRADHPQVAVLPPLLFAGAFLLGLVVERVRPTPLGPLPLRLLLGALLVAASAALAGAALREFRRAGTPVEVWRPATTLVTTGPYRRSRNPLYLALTLLYLGLGIAVGSLWVLLLLLPVLVILTEGVVKREEAYLERTFGEAYRRYRAATPRWI